MKIATRCLSLITAAVMLSACDAMPVEPVNLANAAAQPTASLQSQNGAERRIEEALYDLTDVYVQLTCNDGSASELIALEGHIYERFAVTFDPAGGIHVTAHAMPIGLRGIGTESGEEYRVKEQDHSTGNQSSMGATGSYRHRISFVGRDSRRSFEMTVKGHYTMDANGEFIVERETETVKCDS